MWTMNQKKKKTKKSWFKGPLWDLTGPEIFILDNYLLSIYCEVARYWEYRGKWFAVYSLYKYKDFDAHDGVQSSKCRNLGTCWQFSFFVSSILLTYLHLCVTLGTFQL